MANELEFELVQSLSPLWIGKLQKLETLVLSLPIITILSPEIGPYSVKRLVPSRVQKPAGAQPVASEPVLSSPFEINGLEELRGLDCLVIIGCWKLRRFPGLSELNNLRVMLMSDRPGIVKIRGRLDRLEALTLLNCPSLERLPTKHFVSLEKFHLLCCPKIKGLEDVGEYCYSCQEGISDTGTPKDVIITADKNTRNL